MLYLWLIPLMLVAIALVLALIFRGKRASTSLPEDEEKPNAIKRGRYVNK